MEEEALPIIDIREIRKMYEVLKRGSGKTNMRKIGIVTIVSRNYGNRLQNYALQQALVSNGHQVFTIPTYNRTLSFLNFKIFIKIRLQYLMSYFIPKYRSVSWEMFDAKIKWDRKQIRGNEKLLSNQYDCFVAGSDQIWNPLFECNSERELLTFAPKNKRIAYAASIGINDFPEQFAEIYGNAWKDFANISVRENSAADIVNELAQRKVEVVLDPTMLLTKTDWEEVARRGRVLTKGQYVVKYFLGPQFEEYNNYIEKYCKDNGYELFDILDENGNVKPYIGPLEFVRLIMNCQAVFTDSFHGSVFSIIFEKMFLVFERPFQEGFGKMSSRIDTLLDSFGLQERRISDVQDLEEAKKLIDYSEVGSILKRKRQASYQYLLTSLNAIEDGGER